MSNSQPPPSSKFWEENMSQECKDLFSTLPTEICYGASVCQYKGFWVLPFHFEAIFSCHKHFQAQDSDILLVTTPKSGTTWLKAIMFALLYRRQRMQTTHHALDHPLLSNNPHELVPYLELDLYSAGKVPDLASFPSPKLLATHMPLVMLPESVKTSSCKIVYLWRDPKDTFVSLWHFLNNLRPPGTEPVSVTEGFDNFCRGASIFGPFWDHVMGYWKEKLEKPEKVFFLKYEEMKEETAAQVRRLAEFMGCPFSTEEEELGLVDEIVKLCSFENLSNLEVNKMGKLSAGCENRFLFRQGKVGGWKNYLTDEMGEVLDRICEDKFHSSGLKF